jgi:hypothetical protein
MNMVSTVRNFIKKGSFSPFQPDELDKAVYLDMSNVDTNAITRSYQKIIFFN